ncbi:G5 domain-containing protein [Brevibacterium paucivorans]
MDSSNNRSTWKRLTRSRIAGLTAIALAVGTFGVVPGLMTDDHASVAAEYKGGLRGADGTGAIEKDAQKASDLPAGTCLVSSGDSSGSQAGFSWQNLEPSATSPSKTTWGVSLAFDNSQDRTFADWSFSNSANLGTVLNTGTVPSMGVGTAFPVNPPVSVTHKADESIRIDGSRSQRNLNLFANMTDADVKQYAEADKNNPVRYAWKGEYSKDVTTQSLRATEGGSTQFQAYVNPWPNENIQCAPITVSWEDFEKHVIVEGEETKVGHINIPGLWNGEAGDSLDRMVVEAYDGEHKFIGTSNTQASGGEQLLRVDENGDIYFKWPNYRGTDLATDKNVSFSVLALPRTVEQLKAAVEHENGGFGFASESSNALDRYKKPNVIDSKSFSLDDTEYHSPKYDKTEATIISGVDSATGPLATEPQKVTFKQVPDLIKDLAKKKGEGGFEAKVELDEKYVYEGWTVDMDDDYNVTVTAPENPRPGTFARPKITVEYSNGSTDVLELLVVVDPNNTQVTDLVRPSLSKGKLNEDITAQVGLKPIMKGHKAVNPAKYEIDPATVPEGWTVTVDNTGKVTAKADDTVAPGTVITPKVKATYPDQTTDEIEVDFQAIVDIKIPTYDTVTNKPNASVSLKPTLPERGLSGNTTDEAPKRYTFKDGKTEMTVTDDSGTWNVKIDETTGEITTTIPKTAPEGYILNVPVLAYYDNADKPQPVKGTVVVLKGDVAPKYDVQATGPNQAVNHNVTDAPKGSKFSFGKNEDGSPKTEQEVDGWKYKVDPKTGVVTSTPPADAKPGDKKTVTVTVETPNGERPEVPVTTVVKLSNNWEADPTYPEETVYPGDTATLPVTIDKPDNVNVAKDNPYKLGKIPAGWNVTIDDNGQVTATAPADAKPGTQVQVTVTVTYEDGSTDTAKAVVNVVDVPKREVPFDVEYKYDETIPAGEYRVQTEGKPGEEKQNKDGSWERTKEPVNEVVLVGKKPAKSAKEVTWKVPIPYPTEVRENPDLKPGETRVVQEGENGEKTYTAKFTAEGDKAEVVEEETTKEPVTRIVEYGPRLGADELVTKTEKPIPFETEVEFDPNLPAGEKVVDQKGELGTEVETSTQKLVDGEPSGDPEVTTERTKEPTTEKIRVGTKTEGTHTTSYEKDVPFETEIIFDENLEAGRQETVQEGELGKDKVTTTQTIVNSEVTDTKTETERVTEPVKRIVKVGTKGKPASTTVEWTENTPFEVEVRVNPELKPGETKVVQEGKQGEVKHTVKVNAENGEISKDESTEEISKPTKQIIEVGPATEHQTELTDKHTENTAYDTIIEYDPNLEVGKVVEDQAGVYGEKEITKTWKLKNGEPVGDPEVSEKVIKDPQPRKIRVGAKCNCDEPTEEPTPEPTQDPTDEPSEEPSETPSEEPSEEPTDEPSDKPSDEPSEQPSETPSEEPSPEPTQDPTDEPSEQPSETPSEEPTEKPTEEPSDKPSEEPSEEPSETPSEEPTPEPTQDPTEEPSEEPSETPSEEPTQDPTDEPSEQPSGTPSEEPTEEPTDEPSDKPSDEPSEQPSDKPSEEPTEEPSDKPSKEPSEQPSETPSEEPTQDPTDEPSEEPGPEPTEEPSDKPSDEPSEEPTEQPSDKPSEQPSEEPSEEPGEPGKPGDSPSDEPNDPGKPGQPGDDSDGPGTPGDSSEPGDSGKTGPLPRTGVEVAMAVAMGLGMIGAGIALTVASRRNRRS